jgi:hypothetical protein
VSNYAIVTSARQGHAVTESAIWTRVYLHLVAVFDFVIAVVSAMLTLQLRFGGDPNSGNAMREQRALGRSLTAVVAVDREPKVPREVSTIGLGSASLHVRARVAHMRARMAGFWDCGLGDEIVVSRWGGLRV